MINANTKINAELSDTEILYHLTNELGQLGFITVEHLAEFYKINNMYNEYDIFKSLVNFSSNKNPVRGLDYTSIDNIFGRNLFYNVVLYKEVFEKDKLIYKMVTLLSSLYTCMYSNNMYVAYELLNHEMFKNDDDIVIIIKEVLNGDISIIKNRLPLGYIKLLLTMIFDLSLYSEIYDDIDSINVAIYDFPILMSILADAFRDKSNINNVIYNKLKEHMTCQFMNFIRDNSLYKMNVLKSKFKDISDDKLGKIFTIIDDLSNYIDMNSCRTFTDEDRINVKKFSKNFNKYTIDRLL